MPMMPLRVMGEIGKQATQRQEARIDVKAFSAHIGGSGPVGHKVGLLVSDDCFKLTTTYDYLSTAL